MYLGQDVEADLLEALDLGGDLGVEQRVALPLRHDILQFRVPVIPVRLITPLVPKRKRCPGASLSGSSMASSSLTKRIPGLFMQNPSSSNTRNILQGLKAEVHFYQKRKNRRGKGNTQVQRSDFRDSAKVKRLRQIGAEMV